MRIEKCVSEAWTKLTATRIQGSPVISKLYTKGTELSYYSKLTPYTSNKLYIQTGGRYTELPQTLYTRSGYKTVTVQPDDPIDIDLYYKGKEYAQLCADPVEAKLTTKKITALTVL